jgi:hypothetical protein
MKNNSSKYVLKLGAALRVPGTDFGDVTEAAGLPCAGYGTVGFTVDCK